MLRTLERWNAHSCMRHIVWTRYLYLISCIKISQVVTDIWGVQEHLEKNNQRDITQKLREEKQPFLRAAHCLYLIRIPIKTVSGLRSVQEC